MEFQKQQRLKKIVNQINIKKRAMKQAKAIQMYSADQINLAGLIENTKDEIEKEKLQKRLIDSEQHKIQKTYVHIINRRPFSTYSPEKPKLITDYDFPLQ